MKKCSISFILIMQSVAGLAQCYPTYFNSDKAANTVAVIKQNHIKTEYVYSYIFVNNIFKHPVIKDSVLRYTCTYDKDGNPLVRKMFYKENVNMKDSIVYGLSEKSVRIYRFSVLKTGGRLDLIQDILYNESGNKAIEQGTYQSKDSTHNYTTRFTYNAQGKLNSEIYSELDTVVSTTFYTYNEDGDLTRSENRKPNGILQYGALYEYNRRKNKVSIYSLDRKRLSDELEYNKYGQCTLHYSHLRQSATISLFDYREDGLFSDMKKVQSTLIKEWNRHYYTKF